MGEEKWRKKKVASYKRRMNNIDYSQPQIYMITIVTEGRRKLFGEVVGEGENAHMDVNGLGRIVCEELKSIPRHYSQISIIESQIMPDHLHFILYVKKPIPVHLGRVIGGFKYGCNKRFMELAGVTPADERQGTGRQGTEPVEVECSASDRQNIPGFVRDRKHGLLFEQGYHDRVLSGEGQLQRMIDYIRNNPKRLMMRRANSEWLRPKFGVTIGSHSYSCIGNLKLLDRCCVAVRVSRRSSEEQITRDIESFMATARGGAVLVSPAISPGEKRVMRTAFNAKMPMIVLVENGFTEYSKPLGEQFDACAEGRLLLLAPWEHHTDKRKLTAQQCQQLNLMAQEIEG